jgi:HSP20 family protein
MTQVKFNNRPIEAGFNSIVDDLFTELPALFKTELNQFQWKGAVPVNIKETEKSYQVEVIAPGFEKTDFKVSLEQTILSISAEKKNETKNENEKQVRHEYNFGSFKRSFTIEEKIDATKIGASYVNGVLILNLPKQEPVRVSATEIVIN